MTTEFGSKLFGKLINKYPPVKRGDIYFSFYFLDGSFANNPALVNSAKLYCAIYSP